jgi:antitoxin component of MazEF toxin-antitoxin module
MIALKVEKIGDRVAVVLTEEALAALNLAPGDTLHVEPSPDGAIQQVTRETWIEDPHARGRAFLRRYNKSFERFEG